MGSNDKLETLVEALRCLPSVGAKTAQRMALYLLQQDRKGAFSLAKALTEALEHIGNCAMCHTLTEAEICETCASPHRDKSQLCVVETPSDQMVIEQTKTYKGLYYVLLGRLSPLDGVGPEELNLKGLLDRVGDGLVKEVILATNFTSEGEATSHFLGEYLKQRGISVSRLSRGVPLGGELEYQDLATIASSLNDRRLIF
jgi:recombination protein RecR